MNTHAKRIRLVANMRADLRILANALRANNNPRAAIRADIAGEAVGELYAAMTVLDDPAEERGADDVLRGAT